MHRTRLIALAAPLAVAAAIALAPAAAGAHAATAPTALVSAAHQRSVLAVPKFIFHAASRSAPSTLHLRALQGREVHQRQLLLKAEELCRSGGSRPVRLHETKLALADAQQNKVLKVLVSPLTAVVALFNTVLSKVKGHSLDAATIGTAESQVSSIESQAQTSGSTVSEAIPSAKQLLAGSA